LRLRSLLAIFASTVYLVVNLFFIWLTLGWKVRKARKAFEKQLIKEGMSKKDAEKLSAQYASLKDKVIETFKQQIFKAY
jgi:hypothetical protein